MAWEPIDVQTPTSIGAIRIELRDPDGINDNREIFANVRILDANGDEMSSWGGDAKPHLPAPVLAALASALDDIRTEAEDKLL